MNIGIRTGIVYQCKAKPASQKTSWVYGTERLVKRVNSAAVDKRRIDPLNRPLCCALHQQHKYKVLLLTKVKQETHQQMR